MDKTEGITAKVSRTTDGLGVTLQAMYDGMEGLLQAKTVVGEPLVLDGATLVPLIEVSAGMAGGCFAESAKNKDAAAMSVKMKPVAMLLIQNGRTKLIKMGSEDALSKLVDLIPEAIDKITGKKIEKETEEQAKQLLDGMSVEVVNE